MDDIRLNELAADIAELRAGVKELKARFEKMMAKVSDMKTVSETHRNRVEASLIKGDIHNGKVENVMEKMLKPDKTQGQYLALRRWLPDI